MMIRKLITIRPDQSKYLDENSISLSRFVQRKIDDDMAEMSDAANIIEKFNDTKREE